MYYFALWLWILRGGDTVSIQPTDPTAIPKPRIVGPPLQHAEPTEFRTLSDVEAELIYAAAELRHHRSRRGDKTNDVERRDERPALLVHEVNWLLEEWQALNR